MKISKGKKKQAVRVVLYGTEGIGKTTLAAHFPKPLFIDVEQGSYQIDVERFDGITTWADVLAAIGYVEQNPDSCKTLVLDTADKAEQMLVEQILKEIDTKIILVEIHAEATAEKLAMGYMLDGRVSAVWGTHTHVPTADIQILPGGTGYVTDLGMTGPSHSVLGIRPELSIAKFRGDIPNRYQWANGPTKIEAALFTIDAATGKCRKAERVDLYDENFAQR